MTRRFAVTAASVVLLALATGCGGNSGYGGSGGSNQGGATLSITDPKDGSSTTVPFTVTVQSSAPLGDTNTGKHHIHIWFDDHKDQYKVVTSDHAQITDLSPGQHKMTVSLRNANHSSAGADQTITITVSGGSPNPTPSGGSTGGNGY